ncbi:hypothetical protein O1C19_003506 [Vibrio cholerae]|nr:hypothetical protein [Vibrio cholerae]
MNDFSVAYRILPKSSWSMILFACLSSLPKLEIFKLGIQVFIICMYVLGWLLFKEEGKVIILTMLFCTPSMFSIMKTIEKGMKCRFSYLEDAFPKVISYEKFDFEHLKLFVFIENVKNETFKPINFDSVKNICEAQIKSMNIAPALSLPTSTFAVSFLVSSLTVLFWQSDNEILTIIGLMTSMLLGYFIYLAVSSQSWKYTKLTRLRKYCELILGMSEEEKASLQL